MDWKRFSVLAIASLGLAACVPQQKYDDLLTAYRGQEQQLLSMQSDLQTSRANEERLRAQLAAAAGDLEQLAAIRNGAKGDIDTLLADSERLLKQVGNLNMGPLPAELNKALADLAAGKGAQEAPAEAMADLQAAIAECYGSLNLGPQQSIKLIAN